MITKYTVVKVRASEKTFESIGRLIRNATHVFSSELETTWLDHDPRDRPTALLEAARAFLLHSGVSSRGNIYTASEDKRIALSKAIQHCDDAKHALATRDEGADDDRGN